MTSQDRSDALREVAARVAAIERLEADQLTAQTVAPHDAAWATYLLARHARRWLRVLTEEAWGEAA